MKSAVLGQFGADRREVRQLRFEFGKALAHAGMALAHVVGARGPPRVVRRQHVEQPAQDWRRLADQRDLGLGDPRGFVGIGVDADDRQIAVDAPMQQRHVQVGADRKHRIRFRPQFVAERQID